MAVLIKREKQANRLISIDPSINNLGIAVWELREDEHDLLAYALLHPKKGWKQNEFDKSFSMYQQISDYVKEYSVNRIIMEVPEYWAVAGFEARETGSMEKLMFVCGMVYSLRSRLDEFRLVTPRGWKAQLPKKVVENRLRDDYLPIGVDLSKLNNNVMDGIAIGHFYIHGSV